MEKEREKKRNMLFRQFQSIDISRLVVKEKPWWMKKIEAECGRERAREETEME